MAKKKKEQKLTPFTVMGALNTWQINRYNGNRINNTQRLYSEDDVKESGLSHYLLLHFIKNCPQLIDITCYLNENYKHFKIYDMYLFVFFTFKRMELGAVEWVKSLGKYKAPEDIEAICKYYRVKPKIAEYYLDSMTKERLLYIKRIFDPKAK